MRAIALLASCLALVVAAPTSAQSFDEKDAVAGAELRVAIKAVLPVVFMGCPPPDDHPITIKAAEARDRYDALKARFAGSAIAVNFVIAESERAVGLAPCARGVANWDPERISRRVDYIDEKISELELAADKLAGA